MANSTLTWLVPKELLPRKCVPKGRIPGLVLSPSARCQNSACCGRQNHPRFVVAEEPVIEPELSSVARSHTLYLVNKQDAAVDLESIRFHAVRCVGRGGQGLTTRRPSHAR